MLIDPIYDRTIEDVTRIKALKSKCDLGGWDSLTPSERSEYLAHMMGAVDYASYNRWENNLEHFSQQAARIGYYFPFEKKTWTVEDDFMQSDFLRIVNATNKIIKRFDIGPPVVASLQFIQINALEKPMELIDPLVETTEAGYRYAGQINAGDWS